MSVRDLDVLVLDVKLLSGSVSTSDLKLFGTTSREVSSSDHADLASYGTLP